MKKKPTKKFVPKLKAPKAKAKVMLKSLSALEARWAALNIPDKKPKPIRKQFEHYTGDGGRDLVKAKVAPSKDWAFRTKAEGRPSLVMPKKVNVKLTKQIWPHSKLIAVFRQNGINMGEGSCNWFCLFDTPSRKMTAQDQLDIMLMPHDAYFTVRHNLPKHWLIIEDKGGTIL